MTCDKIIESVIINSITPMFVTMTMVVYVDPPDRTFYTDMFYFLL